MMDSGCDEMMDRWMVQNWDYEKGYEWVCMSEVLLGLKYAIQ